MSPISPFIAVVVTFSTLGAHWEREPNQNDAVAQSDLLIDFSHFDVASITDDAFHLTMSHPKNFLINPNTSPRLLS